MDEELNIDPELWLQYLMAVLPDQDEREKLVQKMSDRSGVAPDQVHQVLEALSKYLLNETRKN
ncbi:MAG: hypothetical protein HUU38_07135 [Anaerolineales bacterium]|nr:hypothetical protein [Anaerolineales bacterium]